MDLFECPVCMTDMVDRTPRCLLCLHTFCTECLTKLSQGSAIQCPTCREITKLKTEDVKELRVDFRLLQMKEYKQHNSPANNYSEKLHCHTCRGAEPSWECKECCQLFCYQCKINHDKIDASRSHQVVEVCTKHQDEITLLCKPCVLPLCKQCVDLDHIDHQENIINSQKGKDFLQQQLETMHDDITYGIKDMNQIHCKNQKQNNLVKEQLEKQEGNLIHKLDEVREMIRESDKKDVELDILGEQKVKVESEGEQVINSLANLQENTSITEFCEQYRKIEQDVEQTLEKIEQVSQYFEPLPFPLAEPCNCGIRKIDKKASVTPAVRVYMPVQAAHGNLEFDTFMFTTGRSDNICPGFNMCMGEQGALVVNNVGKPNVIEVNETGNVVNKYNPLTGGEITAVARSKDKIYIAQCETIRELSLKFGTSLSLDPQVRNIQEILVKDDKTLIILTKSSIYSYDTVMNQTKVLVDKLKCPAYIDMLESDKGTQYFITEWSTHKIKVFDESWRLVKQFGDYGAGNGQFSYPKGIAATNMNTLIIADACNNRISHYTADGKFLSHLISKEAGFLFDLPCGLAYRKPYLWVCSDIYQYIACIRLK